MHDGEDDERGGLFHDDGRAFLFLYPYTVLTIFGIHDGGESLHGLAETALPRRTRRHRATPLVLAASVLLATFFGWLALPGANDDDSSREAVRFALAAAFPTPAPEAQPTYETVSIETLRKGDLVMAMDAATGELARKRVVDVFERTVYELRVLHLVDTSGNPQELKTTDEHPFWSLDANDFIAAGDLAYSDCVLCADGTQVTVASSATEVHPEGVAVYNFEVEDYHTYFVAASGTSAPPVLVHNASKRSCGIVNRVGRFGDLLSLT